MGVSHTVYKWADVEKVPLIIWGYSPIHENTPIYEGKRYCREKMYRNALKGTDSEQYSEIITYDHFKRKNKFLSLYFFNYFRYDETRIIQTLENEYNWSPAKHGSNKADCEIFNVSNYFKIKQNGYGRINIKYSALVRDRQIPLQEALKMISSKETGEEPEDINDVLGKISLTKEYLQGCHSRRLDFVEKFDFNKEFLQLENFKGNSNQKAEILINIIRPEIVRDGGTIEFCGINDGFLMFKLGGDCVGCFLQQVETNYIDTLITRYIPELKGSFPVYDLI
jgi:Fe-S cluster biogenesis protein NfuA